MLTLKKVKELVGAPSHAKRTPSPKMLYEEGIVLLRREFDQGSHLTVYNSGYVLFSAGKRNTVFHIHDCCGDYAYDAAEGKGDVIEEEYFENCEWHIDPIQAYLGADVDMNRANEVRPIFMRLGQVAQRTGCAILLIGHLNKAAGMQSLQRGLGSIDIAAAVRSVMFIGKLKHDPTMRILTHEKSSLAPPGVSLAFSLGDEGGFRWVGEYDITADEMLSGIEPQRETKTQQAKDLICTLLAGGKQVLSEDIDKAALERDIPGQNRPGCKTGTGRCPEKQDRGRPQKGLLDGISHLAGRKFWLARKSWYTHSCQSAS